MKLCLGVLSFLFIFTTSVNAVDGFGGSGDLKLGFGKNQSSDGTSIKSRSLLSYSAELGLWYNYSGVLAGLSAEYSLWRQLTDPKTISNSNTQGALVAAYPMIGFEFDVFRFIAKIPTTVMSSYTLEKSTSSGSKLVYKDAKAMTFQLHWLSAPDEFWGLEYQSLTFKKATQDGIETTLSSSSQFKMSSFGVLFGYYF